MTEQTPKEKAIEFMNWKECPTIVEKALDIALQELQKQHKVDINKLNFIMQDRQEQHKAKIQEIREWIEGSAMTEYDDEYIVNIEEFDKIVRDVNENIN